MTEYQDLKATKEFGTSEWVAVGESNEDEVYWNIYQTKKGDLFATSNDGISVSFEVILNEDEVFIVY